MNAGLLVCRFSTTQKRVNFTQGWSGKAPATVCQLPRGVVSPPQRGSTMSDVSERWLPVVGFEGYYEVSSYGRVRGVERVIWTRNQWGEHERHLPARELTPVVSRRYRKVQLSTQQKQSQSPIHRLVAEAFIGPRPHGMHTCHNDGDNFNNRADNLRYDTPKANVADSIRQGRREPKLKTHCKWGHPFDDDNTGYLGKGTRYCKTCASGKGKSYYAANRAKVLARTGERSRRISNVQPRELSCGHCGEAFTVMGRRPKIYCSQRCNHDAWVERCRLREEAA
jgi:hypothetical protein